MTQELLAPSAEEWLVIIDPQVIFADPDTSAWGSPMWASAVPEIAALAAAYGPERTVVTRFVARPGSWSPSQPSGSGAQGCVRLSATSRA